MTSADWYLVGLAGVCVCVALFACVMLLREHGVFRRKVKVLSKEQLDHAREQAAMRKALYAVLAVGKYGHVPRVEFNDWMIRKDLREFLREILDGRE